MKRLAVLTICCLVLAVAFAPGAQAHNPKPTPGDLTLPLPGGQDIVFRPVFLGQGDGAYSQVRFKMGDPDGGFKEYPTTVTLGGGFVADNNGSRDWCYYMGKYEVTEAQYYAVMGGGTPEQLASSLPMSNVSYFEAVAFADKLNQWLFANALDRLPANGPQAGFVRLPTEAEWEFAARGGSKVTPDQFDRKVPYQGELAAHEWFSGPSSSHNKLKKSGLLEPNILGLHDMLANVTEMTQSLYRIEYYQGRAGGFVAKGGHYLTAENKLRSSLRTEEPFYTGSPAKGYKPNAKPTMGLRLVLSSIVYSDRNAAKELELAWEDYRGSQGADLPAAVSVSPTSVQADVKTREAFEHLARIKAEVAKLGAQGTTLSQELGYIEASLEDMKFIRKQADEDSAYAWAKIAAEQAFFIFRDLQKLPAVDKVLASAEASGRTAMIEKMQQRKKEIEANIESALSSYSESLRQLALTPDWAVEAGFTRYTAFLMARGAVGQVRVLKSVRAHFADYNETKRAMPDRWSEEFRQLAK